MPPLKELMRLKRSDVTVYFAGLRLIDEDLADIEFGLERQEESNFISHEHLYLRYYQRLQDELNFIREVNYSREFEKMFYIGIDRRLSLASLRTFVTAFAKLTGMWYDKVQFSYRNSKFEPQKNRPDYDENSQVVINGRYNKFHLSTQQKELENISLDQVRPVDLYLAPHVNTLPLKHSKPRFDSVLLALHYDRPAPSSGRLQDGR